MKAPKNKRLYWGLVCRALEEIASDSTLPFLGYWNAYKLREPLAAKIDEIREREAADESSGEADCTQ